MPPPMPVKRPATYDDLLRVSDHLVAEILDGELYATPRPAARHAHAAVRLTATLGPPFDQGRRGPGGWLLLFEPELHLSDDVVAPDLAGWRRERLSAVPDAPFLTLPPDWACEILSPSTERLDRLRKVRIYNREGVTHVWLMNPAHRTLEVLRREEDRWIVVATHGGDEGAVAIEPFEPVPLELAYLVAMNGDSASSRTRRDALLGFYGSGAGRAGVGLRPERPGRVRPALTCNLTMCIWGARA